MTGRPRNLLSGRVPIGHLSIAHPYQISVKFISRCTVAILLFILLALRQISCGYEKYCMLGKMEICERRNTTDGIVVKLGNTVMELFEDTYDQVLLDRVHCSAATGQCH